ncbi:MAG: hypothetical protein ACI4QR_02055, partial [Eubacteriales bacterium]
VCNDLFYRMLLHFEKTDIRVGFIHVPSISPDWSKEKIASALESAIEAI